RRHTRFKCDWSSDVCSSDLGERHHTVRPPRCSTSPAHSLAGVAPGAIIGRATMQTPPPAAGARGDALVWCDGCHCGPTTRTTGCLVAVRHAVPLGLPRGVLRRTCAPEREDGHHGTIC